MFASMLMGTIAVPRLPSSGVRTVSADRCSHNLAGINSQKMAEYLSKASDKIQESRHAVYMAIKSGVTTRNEIVEKTGLSLSTVQKRLQDMLDDEVIERRGAGKTSEWVLL